MKRLLPVALALTIGLVFMLAESGVLSRPYTFHGSPVNPPFPAPDIQLTDQAGQPFNLASLRGKPALIFFGYTSCPDVCPLTLAHLKQVRQQAGNVPVVFITVDPARDTAERMASYLAGIDPSITGLTGTEADLAPVWKGYGVYRSVPDHAPSADYEVDHTAAVYLVDGKGNMRATYSSADDVTGITQDVRYIQSGR